MEDSDKLSMKLKGWRLMSESSWQNQEVVGFQVSSIAVDEIKSTKMHN